MGATNPAINVEEVLDGIGFPVAKVQIIVYADEQGASQETMNMLQALPVQNYNNMQEINEELGKIEEQPGSENQWSSNRAKSL